ncbi:MAG: hypothetical protein ACKPKO_61620 [Candidatus Fonsibacter sp.]
MIKKHRLLDENVYTPIRKNRNTGQPLPPPPPNPPPPPPNPPPPPPNPPPPAPTTQQDLTDKDGLDRAYANNDDISLIKNTMYISGTKLNRMSDIYDDITKLAKR